MNGIIPRVSTAIIVVGACSADLVKRSDFARKMGTPFSFGENLRMAVSIHARDSRKSVLIVPRSEMKDRSKARISYVKRMRLLIGSGLIAGITPMSIRRGSGQRYLDHVFS